MISIGNLLKTKRYKEDKSKKDGQEYSIKTLVKESMSGYINIKQNKF